MSPIHIAKSTDMSHLQQYVAYDMFCCRTSVNTVYRLPLVFKYLSVHVAYGMSPQYEQLLTVHSLTVVLKFRILR
jgi:hypothetical protein